MPATGADQTTPRDIEHRWRTHWALGGRGRGRVAPAHVRARV